MGQRRDLKCSDCWKKRENPTNITLARVQPEGSEGKANLGCFALERGVWPFRVVEELKERMFLTHPGEEEERMPGKGRADFGCPFFVKW